MRAGGEGSGRAVVALAGGALLWLSGCGGEAPASAVAPRPAGSAVPMAPPNAESAGSEAVPQTWVSSGHGRGPTPKGPKQAPALPGGNAPAPAEL